jgi:STE24 endopeptidase
MVKQRSLFVLCILALFLFSFAAVAAPPSPVVPAAAQPSAHFDPVKATDAWLATISPAVRARSDSYFDGGCWLILWDCLVTVAIMFLLLATGISALLRDFTARLVRPPILQWLLYWIGFCIVTALLAFPLAVYQDFIRERSFGLSNQTFPDWLRDTLIGFALLLLFGGALFVAVLALVRRFPKTWHWWAALAALLFSTFSTAIAPVLIAPLFNRYTPLRDSPLKSEILALARQNGIAANNVYEDDASRQSKRVSANVMGLFGTDRITLNDNLLNRCSPQAVLSVMGHEMGHYVMHHIAISMLYLAIGFAVVFWILKRALDFALFRWGARWRVSGPADVAALPLAVLILIVLNFVSLPISNSLTRMQEYEADIFGLNSARQPDGEAEVDLLLGEYRKLDPSPLEEFVFFDHPSGRTRIFAAMRWKAENLCLFSPDLPCVIEPFSTPSPTAHSARSAAPLQ